jgi:ComF family protein
MSSFLQSFVNMVYPIHCAGCKIPVANQQELLCPECRNELPITALSNDIENELAQLFWGRIDIAYTYALYHYSGSGLVQNLIQDLKYRNQTTVGDYFGEQLFLALDQFEWFRQIDCIVPVPLHPKKKKKRKYNQAEVIARPLSEKGKVPLITKALVRTSHTQTQTKLSYFERWKNVMKKFEVKEKTCILRKHVLIIDDVITSGSTIEACAQKLLVAGASKISVATVGWARSV